MKKFIEVTVGRPATKVLINTDHIFTVQPYKDTYNSEVNCEISVNVYRSDGNTIDYKVWESYSDVLALIEQSL